MHSLKQTSRSGRGPKRDPSQCSGCPAERMWTGASQRSGTVQGAVEHLGINMLDRMMASSALSQNGRLSGARVARELELVQLSN